MSVETIARRYGTALADVVGKTGDVENVRSELSVWQEMIGGSPELSSIFANPSIAHLQKERLLDDLIERVKPSRTTANFLKVVLRNGRLTELKEINERFSAVLEERSGRVSAEVTSARELSDQQKNELRANLEKLTGKQVQLNFSVDRDIIGGVVTRVGSTIYDGSVRTQLENLKTELMGA